MPFGVYLFGELAHTSGVLAVVVAGLYLGYKAPQSGYATRLQEQAVWRASDTILESVVFALIGLQLTSVVAAAGDIRSLLVTGVIVTLAAIRRAHRLGVPGHLHPPDGSSRRSAVATRRRRGGCPR